MHKCTVVLLNIVYLKETYLVVEVNFTGQVHFMKDCLNVLYWYIYSPDFHCSLESWISWICCIYLMSVLCQRWTFMILAFSPAFANQTTGTTSETQTKPEACQHVSLAKVFQHIAVIWCYNREYWVDHVCVYFIYLCGRPVKEGLPYFSLNLTVTGFERYVILSPPT